jgi:type IV pilus assembly protein PilV
MGPRGAHGASMLEVLVTIVIISFGLLGMAGLQSRMQVSEMEAYQRTQALVLLNDMAARIGTNRNAASLYVTTAIPTGPTANTCPAASASASPTPTEMQLNDKAQWCLALQGAAEVQGASKQGAVVGGRGCVDSLGNGEYMVTVAWQGLVPLSAPPASVTCGQNLYNGTAGSTCVNDLCRRVVTTIVRVAPLL